MSDRLISIVLPVYNQADHIAPIVEEYQRVLGQLSGRCELILAVNGSADLSAEVCRSISSRDPGVRTIELHQRGWGYAVKRGLQESRGDTICYTNSARTSPEDLLLLLLYSEAYPNAVIKANRKIRDNWRRRLGSLLYNLECRALFDLSQWDINGTPKVFPRSCERLLALSRNDDLIDAEFNAICRQKGYPMLEVPIFSSRRHGGSSTTNYGSAIKMYWGAYQLWQSMRPGDPPNVLPATP